MLDFTVTFVITILNITFLCIILRFLLFKPVTKFMEDRASRIRETMENAEREKSAAKNLLAQYEEKLKNADAEAEIILKDARKKAETEAEMIISNAKTAAESFTALSYSRIEAEHKAALAHFKIEAAALVMAASSRLLKREFSGEDERHFTEMLLDELSQRSVFKSV